MPLRESHRIQTRSTTNRDLFETISSLINETERMDLNSKIDLASLFDKQIGETNGAGDEKTREVTTAQYLQALLMLNGDKGCSPPSAKKSGGCLGRRRSVSFSTPEVQREGSRSAAAGNLEADLTNSPVSPIRMRPHASEAGSPTLEQALLMGRDSPNSDAGYGSFQSGTADITSLTTEFRRGEGEEDSLSPNSRPEERSFSPGEPRPTLATLLETDLAVSQAVQKLQELKERQAAIRAEVAGGSVGDPNLLVALLSQSRNNDHRPEVEERETRRERMDMSQLDREIRGVGNNVLADILTDRSRDPLALERAARQYRNAASVHEANCTWSGQLPPKQPPGRSPSYSSKIFLGGVPWDITESALIQAFIEFGPVRVEWPGREAASPPRGYLYIVFEDEDRVKELLANCSQDYSNGGSYYFKIASKKRGTKEIQIIPWLVMDSNYVRYPSPRLDPKKTVFVGALHGMINAQSLAVIFNELFGGVVYAGLDTDKHKYPIGSGRVTFNNSNSYMKAVATAFIEIKTSRFSKKIQVDPYLEDAMCSVCHAKQGPYFCRDLNCFSYYCRTCWDQQHTHQPNHKPLMRNIRGLTRARLQDILPGSTDYYSPNYQNNRENKIFSELWGQTEQERRPEFDGWRAGLERSEPWRSTFDRSEVWTRSSNSFDKGDSWRSINSIEKVSDYWRAQPEITWRNQDNSNSISNNERTCPTWSTNTENMANWSDDYSKITSEFENFCINERRGGGGKTLLDRDTSTFRTVLDRDPTVIRPTSFSSSFRPLGETNVEQIGYSARRETSLSRDQETLGYSAKADSLGYAPRADAMVFPPPELPFQQDVKGSKDLTNAVTAAASTNSPRDPQRTITYTSRELRSFQPEKVGSNSFPPREQLGRLAQLFGNEKLSKLRSVYDAAGLDSLAEEDNERTKSLVQHGGSGTGCTTTERMGAEQDNDGGGEGKESEMTVC